jgi:hypothetical protein
LYAVREMFNINRVSDSVQLSNVHFTPGPWLNTCAFSLPCRQAIDAGAAVNMIFHFTAGAGVNVTVTNAIVFDWRFGIYVDAGATVAISPMEFNFDGTGTMLHVETGGLWAGNALLRGSTTECATYSFVTDTRSGNWTCINLAGPESTLVLDGFVAGVSRGNFIRTNGSNVYLTNVKSGGVGGANDGADYFALNIVGTSGGTNIIVKNSSFAGRNGSAKAHGIVAGPTVSRIVLENNDFSYFNEAVAVPVANTTIITGNWSINTLGSQSVIISGINPVVYRDNEWDKPPMATVTGCGGSGAVVVGGAFSGFFTVGSTNPTTACTLVQPFTLYGVAGGLCNFWGPAVLMSAGPASATSWQVVFGSTVHGQNVFFNCVGQN